MKKILIVTIIILGIAAAALVIFSGAFLFKWYSCANTKSVPEVTERIFAAEKIGLGEKVPCTFRVKCSWSLMPVSAVMIPAEGVQEGKSAEITPGKWFWGTRIWNVTLWIQPYRDGSYKAIPVEINCEGGPDGKISLKTEIPGFRVDFVDPGTDRTLALAGQVAEMKLAEKDHLIWYLAGAVVLILLFILWLIFRSRSRNGTPPEPVWITALNRISELRKSLLDQKTTPETAVIRLTDIVRNFLEKQFSLRAERQTTPEFLESLRHDNGPLDVEQRRFLREFLSSADMIKFARLSADETMFEDAAERAESLIRSTNQEFQIKEKLS